MNNEWPRIIMHVYTNHRAKWLYANRVTECHAQDENGKWKPYGFYERDAFNVMASHPFYRSTKGDWKTLRRWGGMLLGRQGYRSGFADKSFCGGEVRFINPMQICPTCEFTVEHDECGFPVQFYQNVYRYEIGWFDELWSTASFTWFIPVKCDVCKEFEEGTANDLAREHYDRVKGKHDMTDEMMDKWADCEPYKSAVEYYTSQRRRDRISATFARKEEAKLREQKIFKAQSERKAKEMEYQLHKRTRKQPSKSVIAFFQMSNALATIANHENNTTTNAH